MQNSARVKMYEQQRPARSRQLVDELGCLTQRGDLAPAANDDFFREVCFIADEFGVAPGDVRIVEVNGGELAILVHWQGRESWHGYIDENFYHAMDGKTIWYASPRF